MWEIKGGGILTSSREAEWTIVEYYIKFIRHIWKPKENMIYWKNTFDPRSRTINRPCTQRGTNGPLLDESKSYFWIRDCKE